MVAMVLRNADIPSGQGAPQANAAAGSTSNLAVMGITGFVATQEIGQLAQLAHSVPDLSEALDAGTVDRDMFKKVLEQLRANEAQKLSQGLTQVKTFVDTSKRASELKTLQAELGMAKAQQDKKDIEDLLSKQEGDGFLRCREETRTDKGLSSKVLLCQPARECDGS